MTAPDLEALADRIADIVGERIATEFRGFWAPSELAEDIPTMIREAAAHLMKDQNP